MALPSSLKITPAELTVIATSLTLASLVTNAVSPLLTYNSFALASINSASSSVSDSTLKSTYVCEPSLTTTSMGDSGTPPRAIFIASTTLLPSDILNVIS